MTKKSKKKNKFWIPIYICGIILFVLLFTQKFEATEAGYNKSVLVKGTKFELINNNDNYTQNIEIYDRNKYIDVYFNTEDITDKTGKYLVNLYNEKDKEVLTDKIFYNKIEYGGKYRICTSNLKAGTYKMVLTYKGDETNFAPLVNESDSKYLVNDKEMSGSLQYQTLNVHYKKYIVFYCFLTFILILMSGLIYYAIKNKTHSIEKKFLIIAIPIFLLYLLAIPIFNGHDERYHWFRVFEITEGGSLPEIKNNFTGYEMPDAINVMPWDSKYKDVFDKIGSKLDYKTVSFISDVTMSVYSPIQYFPHVIGVFSAKLFTKDVIFIAYIGRIFNMLICIGLLYLAIKKIPFGKNLILAISFIPIAIEGFTTMSGDGFTISISLLLVAYILSLYDKREKLKKKDIAILLLLGSTLALCKLVYLPLVFLVLLLPYECFGSKKKKIISISFMLLLFIILNLTWLKLADPYLDVYTNGKSELQISTILSNPIRYIQIFLYTIQLNGEGYILSMNGSALLWGSAVPNTTFVPIIMIFLSLFIVINDKTLKNKFDNKSIVLMSIIFLMVIGLIFTSLFIQWTCYGNEYIDGVQGRYFLPIIILLFIVVANYIPKKWFVSDKKITKIVLCGSIIASAISLLNLFIGSI